MKVTFISDTHTAQPALPGGDLLIHAGDLTYRGRTRETKAQLDWLYRQLAYGKYSKVVITPGNHEVDWDRGHVPYRRYCKERGIDCLINEGIEYEGFKIWGSPYTPEFCGWAYMEVGADIKRHWDLIPDDTDILITHGPPRGILDWTYSDDSRNGCPFLLQAVERVNPKVHVFGHLHESRGEKKVGSTLFINAAIMTREYLPYNPPITKEIV